MLVRICICFEFCFIIVCISELYLLRCFYPSVNVFCRFTMQMTLSILSYLILATRPFLGPPLRGVYPQAKLNTPQTKHLIHLPHWGVYATMQSSGLNNSAFC
jgi:hypothetical protein